MRSIIRKQFISFIACIFFIFAVVNVIHAEEKEDVCDHLYWGFDEDSSTLYISPVISDLTNNYDSFIMTYTIDDLDKIIINSEIHKYYSSYFLKEKNDEIVNVCFIENENYILKPKHMVGWFHDLNNLTSIKGISNIDTSECIDFSYLFSRCESLNFEFINHLDTSNGKYFIDTFRSCNTIESSEVFNNLDLTSAIDLSYMFELCNNITSFDFDTKNYYKIQRMDSMFELCMNLQYVDFGENIFSSCVSTNGMFHQCMNLKSVDFSKCSFPFISDISGMFIQCSSLKSIDLSNFKINNEHYDMIHNENTFRQKYVRSCPSMSQLFFGCTSLEEILMPNNIYRPYDFNLVFDSCINLKIIDLSNLDISRLSYFDNVFTYCNSLHKIIVDKNKLKYDASDTNPNYTFYNEDYLFKNCFNLVGGKGTKYNDNYIDNRYAHIDGGPDNPGYFTDIADYKPLNQIMGEETPVVDDELNVDKTPIIEYFVVAGVFVLIGYFIKRKMK